jgi:hypothetical protein
MKPKWWFRKEGGQVRLPDYSKTAPKFRPHQIKYHHITIVVNAMCPAVPGRTVFIIARIGILG